MQDFHSIPGLANRLFATADTNNRRPNSVPLAPPQLPVKCPRCDSSNTKFCYYNNYNLSQPRHFCKACRRYWTKGGVLRNVPVGGGCRKSKRPGQSSKSKNSANQSRKSASSSASLSSSESSSLASTGATVDADNSAVAAAELNHVIKFNMDDKEKKDNRSVGFNPFAAVEAGEMVSFCFSAPLVPTMQPAAEQQRMAEAEAAAEAAVEQGFMDSGGDFRMNGNGEIPAGMEWDPATFWSHAQWCDVDPSLYLP